MLSYGEIAQQLQVSRASISSDVQYLREQAKGTIREYVTEHLPEQYQVCLTAFDTILKKDNTSSYRCRGSWRNGDPPPLVPPPRLYGIFPFHSLIAFHSRYSGLCLNCSVISLIA